MVNDASIVDETSEHLKSTDTSGSSQTAKIPFNGPSAAFLKAALTSSAVRPFLATLTTRSTTETLGVGTRSAMPLSLPLSWGNTNDTALAAPVLVGTMFSAAALSTPSIPKIVAKFPQSPNRITVSSSTSFGVRYRSINNGRIAIRRLNAAGLSDIEPDLNEDPVDRWDNKGVSDDDFVYGVYDGHHTYYEGEDKSTFWGSIKEDYAAINPPTGFQGLISWLFLPSVALGMYLNVPGEYLYIGAAIFIVIFCIIEMDKPSEAYNFEPQIYNMERGARDKLISDYNTMDIWDFNEKYGDLWDFTVTKDDIMKR